MISAAVEAKTSKSTNRSISFDFSFFALKNLKENRFIVTCSYSTHSLTGFKKRNDSVSIIESLMSEITDGFK